MKVIKNCFVKNIICLFITIVVLDIFFKIMEIFLTDKTEKKKTIIHEVAKEKIHL
jgi:hypothetical protein